MSKKCSWPGCHEEGAFPAPRNPRDLRDRQYFCKQHITEFNKNWNGLDGFDQDELFAMQSGGATWERPTWKMGVEGEGFKKAASSFETPQDLYNFFNQTTTKGSEKPQTVRALPKDVEEACIMFAIEEPLPLSKLKIKYIGLVKKHHPDVNDGAQTAEDVLKKINVAYKVLQTYAKTHL